MASFFLPSFLSGWDLASVSAFSLSGNLQKRILSYLLKRTLGHLVDGGQLDLANIDAGIGSGRIEVRNVQLDANAINKRLPALPITFVSGQVGRILIQLPVPNFWSGELSVTVSEVNVIVEPSVEDAAPSSHAMDDLSASFASAASQLFVEDEEAQDLEQFIHESLTSGDAGKAQQQEKEEAGSLIATYVEALLTRLKVAIEGVHLQLQTETVDLSIKLKSANVQSSNTRTEQQVQQNEADLSQEGLPHRRLFSETVRTLQLQGFEIWLEDKRKAGLGQDQDSSSSSDASSEDESPDRALSGGHDMTQSIASLRDSSASLYESAIGESEFQDASENRQDAPSLHLATSPSSPRAPRPHLLFSLGQEPVIVTLKTLKERHELSKTGSSSRRPLQRLASISTSVDVQIGNAGAVLFIDHASLLIKLARLCSRSMQHGSEPSDPHKSRADPNSPSPRSVLPRNLALSCHVSSFNLIVGYDDPEVDENISSTLDTFWARPSRSHPDFGHLRLRCDKLNATFANDLGSESSSHSHANIKFTADDLGLFEHLPRVLYEQCPTEASQILPVLILDTNLAHSGEPNSRATAHPQYDYASSTVDVFDWRYSVPYQAPGQRSAATSSRPEGSPRATRFKPSETRSAPSSSGQSPYFRTAYGDRGWKLRPPTRSQHTSHGNVPESTSPNVVVSISLGEGPNVQGRISASVAPIHCFVDISLVTRLMPALRRFAASQITALQDDGGPEYELTDSIATLATSVATLQASPHDLLDDLGAGTSTASKKSAYSLDLKIGLIRIEVRTPQVSYDAAALAGRDLGSARRSGLDRRSGILVLQVQGLDLQSGLDESVRPAGAVRFSHPIAGGNQPQGTVVTTRVSAEKISAFLALPSESRALVLAVIQAVHDEDTKQTPFTSSPSKLLPRLEFSTCAEISPHSRDHQVKDRCSVSIPSVKVELGKKQLDSLQYAADDLTQSINLWSSEDLDDSDSEGLKILGSRFFGSRGGLSIMSTSTDSTATATARATTKNSSLLVTIDEASIRLWLPSVGGKDEAQDGSSATTSKSLLLMTSDFELLFDSDKVRTVTRVEARVPQLQLSVEARSTNNETSSLLLAYRTMERSLDERGHNTMLLLVLEAYAEPGTSYREQNVDLTLCSVTLSPAFDEELIPRIKRLFKAPAGVFENVEPNEVTRISFKAKDCSVYVAPPGTSHRASVALGEVSVKTRLTSHAPKTAVKLAVGDLDLFAIEAEAGSSSASRPVPRSASEHWASRGFARIVHIPEGKGSVNLNSLTRPEVDVKITKLRVKLQAAADTLEVLTGVISAITTAQGSSSEPASLPADPTSPPGAKEGGNGRELFDDISSISPSTTAESTARMAELMSGIEDDAYRLADPLPTAGADMVDDDVPSDEIFLGAKGRYHPEIVETTLDSDEFFGGESVASLSLLAPRTDTVIYADEDVTIRLLDPKGICPVQEYFTDPDLRPQVDSALGPTASSVRVRVSNFDLSVRLHSGYDWERTRKAVRQEAKLVRKRLQKIMQLLAEGQVPDDSVEAATSNLLDSIHISLPHVPAEMDPEDMMQAVEEEIGDQDDAASVAESEASSSWQALPTVRRDHSASRSTAAPAAHSKDHKLHRSLRSLIDFNFRGLEVEFDKSDPSQPSHVVSRIAVNARRFEIIDNIKTSTWRTFLTEMQDRNAAAIRQNADSKMVKIEILNVRPQGDALEETPEVRLRAKIAPLRLHVDQDALDFLKKFFTFIPPGQPDPAPIAQPLSGPPLPFVQFAEVLPIKIKLDYKPKRIDYNLLRQGKTIELMNFFHFEGSEMVLRHITLRGINGWARLFDTLNDIWTPDVKANQLADFLSGLGPIRSLVNVGAGLADLVLLPIEQYHKDGRVLRGVQKGATSFAKSTALEAVKLGARLATGTQVILEQAEGVLGGEMREKVTARAVGPDKGGESYESLSESIMVESTMMQEDQRQGGEGNLVSKYASAPEDMRDALSQAYSGLTEGLTSAAQTILAIPMEFYEPDTSGSGSGAVGGGGGSGASAGRPVVKAVPIAILRGARGATQAIAKTMQGVQVSLGDSENVREGKYKLPSSRR